VEKELGEGEGEGGEKGEGREEINTRNETERSDDFFPLFFLLKQLHSCFKTCFSLKQARARGVPFRRAECFIQRWFR